MQQEDNTALKNITKGAGIFIIGLFVSKVLTYFYRLIIARTSVEQYGLLSIALAVFGILTTISLLGTSEGVVRFVAFYKGKLDPKRVKGVVISALKMTLVLSVIFGAFLFFASDWIAVRFFSNKELSILFKVLAFGIPFDVLRSVFFSSIKAFQRVEYEVYGRSLAENLTKILLTLLALHLGLGVYGATIAYVISVFISFVLSFYFMEKKVFPVFNTSIISISSDKTLFYYSIPLLFTGFIYLTIQWTDTLILGNMRTTSEVGIYNVVLNTSVLLYIFSSAIRTLFFPILSEIYAQENNSAFKSVYRAVTKWILILDSMTVIFLITFSKQIISFLFGEAYVIDKTLFLGYSIPISVLTLIILASSIVPSDFVSPAKDALLVLKRTKLMFFNTTVGSILNIILNLILIPKYGMIGAAIATSFAYLTIFMSGGIEVYIITKINPFKRSCFGVIISASILSLIILIFRLYSIKSIFLVVITVSVLSVVYFSLLFLTGSFEEEDKSIMRSIKNRLQRLLRKNT